MLESNELGDLAGSDLVREPSSSSSSPSSTSTPPPSTSPPPRGRGDSGGGDSGGGGGGGSRNGAGGAGCVGANIDCFKCASLNGDNPSCEDPFHNNFSAATLESPCMGGRKGRDGLFPATACIKMAGVFVETGETITVRGCALDSGTLNTDTEIIRMSHCGHFFFEDRYVKGCLKSCEDSDGCNPSARPRAWDQLVVAIPLQLLATFHLLHTFFSIRTQLL
ncbi:hypothetical protein Fcan01_03843 [Folsomia candida]|uniref:Protein sleepless n=1 Tax=Folsomia candida TaxID=158441 RepID=A0A226F0Y8_FOLCA|nr:hypothetical protein Fcan01_03843 [Folsomia candida]